MKNNVLAVIATALALGCGDKQPETRHMPIATPQATSSANTSIAQVSPMPSAEPQAEPQTKPQGNDALRISKDEIRKANETIESDLKEALGNECPHTLFKTSRGAFAGYHKGGNGVKSEEMACFKDKQKDMQVCSAVFNVYDHGRPINGFSVEGLCVSNAAMGIAAVREMLQKEEFLPHVDIQDALDRPLLLAD